MTASSVLAWHWWYTGPVVDGQHQQAMQRWNTTAVIRADGQSYSRHPVTGQLTTQRLRDRWWWQWYTTKTHNSNNNQIGFTFLVLAHPGSPGKRAVTRVCVCVYRSACVSWHLQLRTGGFCRCKFYCPHAFADGNQQILIREKTLEFSSCYLHCLHTVRLCTTKTH